MKTVSVYDKATGLFTGQQFRGHRRYLDNDLQGLAYVEGEHDPALWRVEDGKVVPREQPPGHVWHAPIASFIEQSKLDAAKRDAEARAELARLDASQHRPVLEAALGDADAIERLRAIHAKKAELRKELARNAE